jgi:hypothetical protein
MLEVANDVQFTEVRSGPSWRISVEGVDVEIERPPKGLNEHGRNVLFDCGVVFGNVLIQDHKSLHYGITITERKVRFVNEALPVILGFPRRMFLYAPNNVLNCVRSYLSGVRGRVIELYDYWGRLAEQDAAERQQTTRPEVT